MNRSRWHDPGMLALPLFRSESEPRVRARATFGMRLDVVAGGGVRWEPGEENPCASCLWPVHAKRGGLTA